MEDVPSPLSMGTAASQPVGFFYMAGGTGTQRPAHTPPAAFGTVCIARQHEFGGTGTSLGTVAQGT